MKKTFAEIMFAGLLLSSFFLILCILKLLI